MSPRVITHHYIYITHRFRLLRSILGRTAKLSLEQVFEARRLMKDVPDRERKSTYDVAAFFLKEYSIEIDHTNVSRQILKLERELEFDETLRAKYEAWKAKASDEGKIFYKSDPVTGKVKSDYPTVQSFIDRRMRGLKGRATLCKS